MLMDYPAQAEFVHRENRDGTIDSICRRCFVTVVSSTLRADLERREKDHICDPLALARFGGHILRRGDPSSTVDGAR